MRGFGGTRPTTPWTQSAAPRKPPQRRSTDMNPRQTADAIAAAMTARDHQALMDLYADDVVFHSPATAVTFRGKSEVGALMAHVLAGFESWQPTFLLADDEQCVFGAPAHIRGPGGGLAQFL